MGKSTDLMTYVPWIVGGIAVYEGYFLLSNTAPPIQPDPLHDFIKSLSYKAPTVTQQSFSPPTSTASGCTVVCPAGQHPDGTCTCVQDTVSQTPITTLTTPPVTTTTTPTPTPPAGLQGSYSNELTFRFPTQSLRWPSPSANIIVDDHESAYPNTQVDVTQITLYADNTPFLMKPYSGPLWSLVLNFTAGVHSLKAIAKYKNGWSTTSATITFTVL